MNGTRYGIYYDGRLAETHLNRPGARLGARKLIKSKGWPADKVTIKEIHPSMISQIVDSNGPGNTHFESCNNRAGIVHS